MTRSVVTPARSSGDSRAAVRKLVESVRVLPIFLIGLTLLLAACSPGASVAPAATPNAAAAPSVSASPSPAAAQTLTGSPRPATTQTVRLGASNTGATNAPVYLGDALGYFADQGITVDENFLPSASEVIPALTRGDLDAAIVGMNPATMNALASNFGLKLVCDSGSQPAGYPGNIFVVSKQVADTIKGPADLRGKKVALTPPGLGTASGYMLSRYLVQAGMTPSDVDLVALNFPDQIAALTNHSIDAALSSEPFATRAIQTGGAVLLATGDQFSPDQQISSIVFTDRFIATQHDLGVKFITAYLRGVRTYLAAFGKGDNRDQVIQVLTQKTDIKDPVLWTQIFPTGSNPDGTLNVQSITDSQAFFQSLGLVQKPIDPGSVIDTSFTQAALQTLGPAPTPSPPHRS